MKVAGLFAGIGGFELGLAEAGFHPEFFCEIDSGAAAVLNKRFPGVRVAPDIRAMKRLPDVDVITAGFPCQDLSQAGRTAGIRGENSGLVQEVFRLLKAQKKRARWLVIENVPFMLQLARGEAMRMIVDELNQLGYTWAYRVVDARAFGVPQRRLRVLLVASCEADPRSVLFDGPGENTEHEKAFSNELCCGFYWTEGVRGLGWAVDSVPTLKGGSGLGIPSPPAIWNPAAHSFSTPDIRDAERLQGFPVDWTLPAVQSGACRKGHRWKMVGNAVCVEMARWLGERLAGSFNDVCLVEREMKRTGAWPLAAWGRAGSEYAVECSTSPRSVHCPHLHDFLKYPVVPLSEKAAAGFLSRTQQGTLRFVPEFIADLKSYVNRGRLFSLAA